MQTAATPFSSSAKGWTKKILLGAGALQIARRFAAPSAVVLMYHSVVEDPRLTRDLIGLSQSRASFEEQVRSLAQRFTPVTLDQVVAFANGSDSLPKNAVAVTFDDGFADNYEVALPILNRYGVPATFYIMVDAVESGLPPWYCRLNIAFRSTRKPTWTDPETDHLYPLGTITERAAALHVAHNEGARKAGDAQARFVRALEDSLEFEAPKPNNGVMMTWDQIRAIRKSGHIVGAHTISHPNLAHVSQDEARSEIMGSKQRLQQQLGETVDHFCYPNPALQPQWTPQTLQITREAGFKSAVLTTCGPVRRGDDPLTLKRIYSAYDLQQWTWNMQCTFLGRAI